jgi:hypothetical protein
MGWMGSHTKGTRIMLSEIRALFGNRIFFVVIGIGAAIFVWREFFASAAAPSSAINVIEQGRNAEQREKGIASGAESDAVTKAIEANRQRLKADVMQHPSPKMTKEEQIKQACNDPTLRNLRGLHC